MALGGIVLAASDPQIAFPAFAAIVAAVAAWIALVDLRQFTIPDEAAIAWFGLALVWAFAGPSGNLENLGFALLSGLICAATLLALREAFFRFRGIDGLGLGDVKLALGCGALIGETGFVWAILLSSLAGLLVIFVQRSRATARSVDRVAFGALLAPACWALWLLQVAGWLDLGVLS